jgi:hypothetical protein
MFEWNNAKAAELYRQKQARNWIEELEVVIETPKGPRYMPVAVSVIPNTGYMATEDVMTRADLRKLLLNRAFREADSWQMRYAELVELSEVFKSIVRAKKRAKAA